MTDPERWRRVERLFHGALRREEAEREGFLELACAGDGELLREVRSLLAREGRGGRFIDEPAMDIEARQMTEASRSGTRVRLEPGTRLGAYEIVALLGAGGMGEVYRARDLRLDREVAVKVLPAETAADPARVRRFQQEARAAGSLNHPGILSIHDLGEDGGAPYLVSELLEGQTLRERMQGGRLPVRTTVDYALQAARGLAAAHDKGIVHRDLKPENLFLTKDGRVKILDFGLAKLMPHEGTFDANATTAALATGSGTVLGTVGYMSPEQVRGEETGPPSDIFSLGAVLYEQLSGRRAFQRENAAETLNAILNDDPPELTGTGREVAPGLVRIVYRCLEKRPEDRFRSAHDLALALEAISSATSGSPLPGLAGIGAGRRGWSWWVAAVSVAALAIAATVAFRGSRSGPPLPRLTHATKLTAALAVEDYPAWSPDGRTLAYQSDEAGNWDIWVAQVGTTEAANRTADSPVADVGPSWSPDGRWISFFSRREGGGYFVMPAVGGMARKMAAWPLGGLDPLNPIPATWSPDSTQIAYALGQTMRPWIEILTLSDGTSRTLSLPARPRNNAVLEASWSPDGRWLAYARAMNDAGGTSELWVTRTSDGASFQLTDGTSLDRSPTWAGPRSLHFVSNRGGTGDLWRCTLRDGGLESPPQQLTVGMEMTRATFSADGRRLAYAVGRVVRNLFRAPLLPSRPATWMDVTQLTFQEASLESVDVSRDGRLAFASDRGGGWDVWVMPAGGGTPQQLTTDPAIDTCPQWKPDGSEVVFYSTRSGHRQIWVMPAQGGPARQLTHGEEESRFPDWSPTGREIVMHGPTGLSIVAAQGGEERPLTDHPTDDSADWSPDGRWIAFDSLRDGTRHLWRVAGSGGPVELLTESAGAIPDWSRDGKRIYYAAGEQVQHDVRVLDMDTRAERPVTDLASRPGHLGGLALTTDEHSLYFGWEDPRGDIWIAEVATPTER